MYMYIYIYIYIYITHINEGAPNRGPLKIPMEVAPLSETAEAGTRRCYYIYIYIYIYIHTYV